MSCGTVRPFLKVRELPFKNGIWTDGSLKGLQSILEFLKNAPNGDSFLD